MPHIHIQYRAPNSAKVTIEQPTQTQSLYNTLLNKSYYRVSYPLRVTIENLPNNSHFRAPHSATVSIEQLLYSSHQRAPYPTTVTVEYSTQQQSL